MGVARILRRMLETSFAQNSRYHCLALGIVALLLVGCESITKQQPPAVSLLTGPSWQIYAGETGQSIDWDQMQAALLQADIVLIGEQHDNAIAHQLQQRFARALFEAHPDSALAMEMFERDEQVFLDFYLNDQLSAGTLIEVTNATSWSGTEQNWLFWYQPLIDTAKAKRADGARVIAANAPRAYVRLARLEGYEVLDEMQEVLPEARFVLPDESVEVEAYRERFRTLMVGEDNGHEKTPGIGAPDMDVDAFFRAQHLWDATMADAVVAAAQVHPKVLLIAGDFHLANQGGTYRHIVEDAPEKKLLTVSIIRSRAPDVFDPEDTHRADYIIYTRE